MLNNNDFTMTKRSKANFRSKMLYILIKLRFLKFFKNHPYVNAVII